jgi:hypothetical protein
MNRPSVCWPYAATLGRVRAGPWRRTLPALVQRPHQNLVADPRRLGPDRLNASQRRDLMEIVEDRYEVGSTLITNQLPIEAWHDVIGEPTR